MTIGMATIPLAAKSRVAPMPGGAVRVAGVAAVLGPTNTGKTHHAIERMLSFTSGMIGLPLRLLAREVYARVVELAGGLLAVASDKGNGRAPVEQGHGRLDLPGFGGDLAAQPLDDGGHGRLDSSLREAGL